MTQAPVVVRPWSSALHPWALRCLWFGSLAWLAACNPVGTTGSTLVTLQGNVLADGNERGAVQLVLRDDTGVVRPGCVVEFFGDGNATFFQPGVTDATGTAVAYLVSSAPGTVQVGVRIMEGSTWQTLALRASVAFYLGQVQDSNGLNLSLVTSPAEGVTADLNTPVQLSLTVQDANGALLGNRPVVFTADAPSAHFTPQQGNTTAAGTFVSTLVATEAKDITVVATVGHSVVQATVAFVAGPWQPNGNTLVATPSSLPADGTTTAALTFVATDRYQNPVANLAVTLGCSGADCQVTPTSGSTDAGGKMTAQLLAASVGTATVSATDGNLTVLLPVPVTPTVASALYSRVAFPIRAVQADGVSQIPVTVTVSDTGDRTMAEHNVWLFSTDPCDSFAPNFGQTDANGAFVATMRSQRAGAKSILATLDATNVGATATFVPLAADPVLSAFSATPSVARASKRANVTLLLVAKDRFGNVAAHEPVRLSSPDANAVLSPLAGQTDSNGLFQATLAHAAVGNVVVQASLRVATLSSTVQFISQSPNAALSQLVAAPTAVVADGQSAASLTATFLDALGNPLTGCKTTFAAPGNSLRFASDEVVAAGGGRATNTLASSAAQTVLVTASCQNVTLAAPVQFVAGPPAAARSSLMAVPPTALADNNALVTVVVAPRDAQGNPAVGQSVVLTNSGVGTFVGPSSGVVGADGTFRATLRAAGVGNALIQAQLGNVVLQGTVPFVAGAPSAATSSFVAQVPVAPADSISAVQLLLGLRDAYGNPVAATPVSFRSTGGNNRLVAQSPTTNAQGQVALTASSPTAGKETLAAVLPTFALQANVQFVVGAASAQRSSFVVTALPAQSVGMLPAAVADGNGTVQLRVAAIDAFGNVLAGLPVALTSNVAGDAFVPASGTTDAAGNFVAKLVSHTAGLRQFSAQMGDFTLVAAATFVAGAVDPAHCSLVIDQGNVLADGVAASGLTVKLQDAYGNPIGAKAVTFSAQGNLQAFGPPTGTLQPALAVTDAVGMARASLSSRTADQVMVQAQSGAWQASLPLRFYAGAPKFSLSQVSVTPAVGVADANGRQQIVLSLVDAAGNPVAGALPTVVSSNGNDVLTVAAAATNAAGLWTATLAAQQAGQRVVEVVVGDLHWSVPVQVLAGPVDLAHSRLEVLPNSLSADANAPATLVAHLCDAYGNAVANQNVCFSASGTQNLWGSLCGQSSAVGDVSTTLASTLAGTRQVTAKLAGAGNLFLGASLTVVAGAVDANATTRQLLPSPPMVGLPQLYTLILRDAYGNLVPGAAVQLQSSLATDSLLPATGVTDANGTFTTTVRFAESGQRYWTAVLGGTAQTSSLFVQPGLASAQNSVVLVQPSAVVADGQSTATLQLVARDAYGNPAGNQVVLWTPSTPGLGLLPLAETTDAAGLAQASARSELAGNVNVQVMVGGALLVAPVSFVAGRPDTSRSQLLPSKLVAVADGNDTVAALLELVDAFGNPVANHNVCLGANSNAPGLVVVGPRRTVTDAAGQAQLVFASTLAGPQTLRLRAGAVSLSTQASFVAGSPNAALSTLTITPPTITADSGNFGRVDVFVADAFGNAVAGQVVQFRGLGAGLFVAPAGAVTDAQGRASASVLSAVPGSTTLEASLTGTAGVVLSAPVTVAVGAPSQVSTHLVLPDLPVLANGNDVAVLAVVVADAAGNPIGQKNVLFAVGGHNNVLSATGATTDANGLASITLASTYAEAKQVNAAVGALTVQGNVPFVAGPLNLGSTRFVSLVAAPVALGTPDAQLSLVLRDATQNPLANERVDFFSSNAGDVYTPSFCTTDASGSCSTWLASTVAETKTLTARVAGRPQVLTTALTFVAGPLDGNQSSLQLDAHLPVANQNDGLGVRVAAKDACGNPLANVAVQLAVDDNVSTFVPAGGVTDAQGNFAAVLTSSLAGVKQVQAQVGNDALRAQATFVPGPADANASSFVTALGALTADGNAYAELTLVARDAFHNPIAQLPVSLTESGSGNTVLTPADGTTNAQGFFVAQFRGTQAGPQTLTAHFAEQSLAIDLALVAGPVLRSQSRLVLEPNTFVASVVSGTTARVTLQDAFGNPVANQNVFLTYVGDNVAVTSTQATTDANGLWSATVQSTLAQNITLSSCFAGTQLTQVAVVLPAAASSANSLLAISDLTPIADGVDVTHVTVTLRDAYNNIIVGAPVGFASNGVQDLFVPVSALTNAHGRATSSLTSTLAGDRALFVTAGGLVLAGNVTFQPGLASSHNASLTLSANTVLANNQDTLTAQLVLRDAYDNPVANQNVLFAATGANNTLSTVNAQTDANGLASTGLLSSLAEVKKISASANDIYLSKVVTFVAGPPDANLSALLPAPVSEVADGVTWTTVTAKLKDSFGNPVPNYPTTWTHSGAGAFASATVLTDATGTAVVLLQTPVAGTQEVTTLGGALRANVTFIAGPVEMLHSSLVATPAQAVASTSGTSTLCVTARDALGNATAGQAVSFSSADAADVFAPPTCTTDATGACCTQLSAPVAGQKSYAAAVSGLTLLTQVQVAPGAPSGANSRLLLSPASVLADGQAKAQLSLGVQDALGNPIAGAAVQLGADPVAAVVSPNLLLTNAAGEAVAEVMSTRAQATQVLATVQAGNDSLPLTGNVTFIAALPAISHSRLTVSPNAIVADNNQQAWLTLVVRDAYDNPVPGRAIAPLLGGSAACQPTSGNTDANGQFSCAITTQVAQSLPVQVDIGGAALSTQLIALAGPVDANRSALMLLPNAVVADGASSAQITAVAQDAFGNPVANQTVHYAAGPGVGVSIQGPNNVTDADGRAGTQVRGTVAQTTQLAAQLSPSGVTLQAPLVLLPGVPQAGTTTLALSANVAGVGLGTQVQATATVLDAFGNAVPNQPVQLTANAGAMLAGLPATATTDANGQATFAVGSTVAQTRQLTLTAGSVTTQAGLTFLAGQPNAALSTFLAPADNTNADGLSLATFDLDLRDDFGNAAGNVPVQFAVVGGNATLLLANTTTDAVGSAEASLVSTVAGSVTVQAQFAGQQLSRSSSFLATQPAFATSTLVCAPNPVVADGNQAIVCSGSARDVFGNPVAGQAVSFGSTGSAIAFVPPQATTASDGSYSVQLQSTLAQSKVLSVNLGAAALFAPIQFVAGSPNANNSRWLANPNVAVANNTAQISLVLGLFDAFNNPVAQTPVSFSVDNGNGHLALSGGNTGASGLVGTTLSSAWAGNMVVRATALGTNYDASVRFVPGEVAAAQSAVALMPSTVTADGQAAMTFVVTARDASGNPVAGAGLQLNHSGVNAQLQNTLVTDANGQASVQLTSTQAGAITVTALSHNVQLAANASFVAGAVSDALSSLTSTHATTLADGASQATIRLTLQDAFGNAVVGQPVSFTASGTSNSLAPAAGVTNAQGQLTTYLASTVAENKAVQASYGAQGANLSLGFVAGPATSANSSIVSSSNSVVANGISVATVTVRAKDAFNNAVAGANVQLSSTGVALSCSNAVAQTDATGTATFQCSTAQVQNTTVVAQVGEALCSLSLSFVPGAADIGKSSLALAPNVVTADGVSPALVTLQLQDASGHPAANVPVSMTSSEATDTVVLLGGTASNALGVFQAQLQSRVAGLHHVTVTAAGLSFAGDVTFVHGALSAVTSSLVLQPQVAVANGNAAVQVAVVLRDAQQNPVAGQNIVLTVDGSQNLLSAGSQPSDASGAANFLLRSTHAETKRISAQAGNLVLLGNATFVPGPIDVSTSTFVVTPNQLLADGATLAEARLVLQDSLHNAVSQQNVVWGATGVGLVQNGGAAATDGNGVATRNYASTVAQSAEAMAQVAGQTFRAPLTFVAGAAAAASSTLTLSPNAPVRADGSTPASLYVFVADAYGNPLVNVPITLTAVGQNVTFHPGSGVTNALGILASTLTSTVAEGKLVQATVGTGVLAPQLTTSVTFVPGPVSLATSSLTASPNLVAADGNSKVVLSVRLLDATGNWVANQNVGVTASGGQNLWGTTSGQTNAQGQWTTTLASPLAQAEVVTLQLPDGSQLSVPVSFQAGLPSPSNSSLVVSPNTLVASAVDNANLQLVLRDAQNNPVANATVLLDNIRGNAVFANATGTTDANGVFTTRLHATLAMASQLEAVFGTASLAQNFVIVPGPPSPLTSSVAVSNNNAVADGLGHIGFHVTAKDAFGNRIDGLPVALALLQDGNQPMMSPANGNTVAGNWDTSATSTVARSNTVTATLGPNAAGDAAIAVSASFAFVPGPPVAARSTLVASPNTFTADNVAQSNLTVTLRDGFGNLVPNQNVIFSVPGVNITVVPANGLSGAGGNLVAVVKTTRAQALTAQATINGNFALTQNIAALPGPTAAFVVGGVAGGVPSVTSSVQVAAFDAYANATPAYNGTVFWNSSDLGAGLPNNYTFTAADAGVHVFANGITLRSAGNQNVTVRDVGSPSIAGSQNVTVSLPLVNLATLSSQTLASSCLELQNGNTTGGTPLVSRTCNNRLQQVLTFGTDGGLRVLGNCLEVAGGIMAAGQAVQGNVCTLTPRQRFALAPTGQVVAQKDANFCLDSQGAADGTPTVLAACDAGNVNQRFVVRSTTTRLMFVNPGLKQVLEAAASTVSVGTALRNNVFSNAPQQSFNANVDGTLGLQGLCVQAQSANVVAGTQVAMATCTGAASQQFALTANGIVARQNPNFCLDIGTSATPTPATLQPCGAAAGQLLAASAHGQSYRYQPSAGAAYATVLDFADPLGNLLAPLYTAAINPSINQSVVLNANGNQTLAFGAGCIDTVFNLLTLLLSGGTLDNQPLYVNPCAGSATQNWRVVPVTAGSVQMQWQYNTGYCMAASPNTNVQLAVSACNANAVTQRFNQICHSTTFAPLANLSLCLDVNGGLPVAGSAAVYNSCGASTSQSWVVQSDQSMMFNNLCLAASGTLAAGSPLQFQTCDFSSGQKWRVLRTAAQQNVGAIQSVANPALCIDNTGAAAGGAVKLANCAALSLQGFNLH